MFCDITWGAGGSTADLTLDIATKMQNMVRPSQRTPRAAHAAAQPSAPALSPAGAPQICVETMMHLTCTNMPRESLKSALDKARTDPCDHAEPFARPADSYPYDVPPSGQV